MSALTRITISLPQDVSAQVAEFASETDRTASSVVRLALRKLFEDCSPSLPQCQPLAAADGSPPSGRGILAGSGDRPGSASDRRCFQSADETGAGRAELGGHYVSSLERALAHSQDVAEQQRQARGQVDAQNRDYLRKL